MSGLKKAELAKIFPYGGYPPPKNLTPMAQAQYVIWIKNIGELRDAGLTENPQTLASWTAEEARMIARLPADFQAVCRESAGYLKRYTAFVSGSTAALPGLPWLSSTRACLEMANSTGNPISSTVAQ